METSFASSSLINFFNDLQSEFSTLDNMIECINSAIPHISEQLHLGKLTAVLSAPPSVDETHGLKLNIASYMDKDGFSSDCYEKTFVTGEKGHVKISAWPKRNYVWTDTEESEIDFVIGLLYLFCSRARLTNLMHVVEKTDALTGSLNLRGFQEIAAEILAQNKISSYSVLFMNLKNFKYINKKVGSDNGDLILRKYSQMIMDYMGSDGHFSRLGGDNFICLVTKKRLDELLNFISDIHIEVNNKGGAEFIKIATRIGVYETDENTNFGDIMSNSSVAFQAAKRNKELSVMYFKQEMLDKVIHDKGISNRFSESLSKNEFKVYYQPKVLLSNNTLCGCEALTRWHANKIINPDEFIPVLEHEGYVKMLDFFVLEQVCKDIRDWLDRGIEPVRVSTNFSKLHLSNENFEEQIISTLKKYGVDPKYIELELTELSDYNYLDRLLAFVTTTRVAGFHISIDDFGTGYSSMSLVRNLKPDVLKLDRSLINNVQSDSNGGFKKNADEIICRSIINMAHELKIDVITEGVETKFQAEFLRRNGCLMAQGFLYDRPLKHDEFEIRLKNKKYEI